MTTQRTVNWYWFAGLGLTAIVLLVLPDASSPVLAGERGTRAPADAEADTAWPVLGPAAENPPPLRIETNAPRGTLRVAADSGAGLVLHALCSGSSGPYEARYPASFAGDAFVEFYGLEAGARWCYLELDGRVSELLAVEIPASGVAEIELPELRPAIARSVHLLDADGGAAASGATVLLQYGSFDLLEQWRGEPIELRAPLHEPRRLIVRVPASDGPDGSRGRLGIAQDVADFDDGDIRVALPRADGSVALAGDGDESVTAARQDYGIELSAGLNVVQLGKNRPLQQILAVLRRGEFDLPPRAHTWLEGEPEEQLTIEETGDGPFWVGVGLSRRARYVLWREQEAGVSRVQRTAALEHSAPAAADIDERLVLPAWIRSVGREEALGAGPREEHRAGASQVWEQQTLGRNSWRRLVALADGFGGRREIGAGAIALPRPADLRPTDVTRVTVRLPHSVGGTGERFALEHHGHLPATLPAMPDGLLDGVVIRRGRTERVLRGVIRGGRLLGDSLAWRDPRSGTATEQTVEVRVVDASDRPLADVELFAEDGRPLAATGADGVLQITTTPQSRHPITVPLQLRKQGFTRIEYAAADPHRVRWLPRTGRELTWSDVQTLIGVDLGILGVGDVFLGRQATGETAQLSPASSVTLEDDDLLEFAVHVPGTEAWGWFDRGATSAVLGPTSQTLSAESTAEIVLLNRSVDRRVHVSLPRTELRIEVPAGRQRRVRVAAPVRLGLLSVVPASSDADELIIDEGITARLEPRDALVVTYDGQ